MAATWIKPIHQQQRGTANALKKVVDYVTDPAKTYNGELVTAYGCNAENAVEEFALTKDDYHHLTGRDQGESEILTYHIRQAFKPMEVDAETVNKLGHELTLKLTNGNNAYIVATHIDKEHIHNHIIINAYNLDCERKFVNPIRSYKMLREISDRICEENNLSVIESPSLSKSRIGDQRYNIPSMRTVLVGMIDEILTTENPRNFDEMLAKLREHGCEIKRRGKTISVKPPMAKRYFRFRTGEKGLPEGYDEQTLREKISQKHKNVIIGKKFKMVIDIENSIKAKNSIGYKKWAMSHNLQNAAEMLLFLQNNSLTDYEKLSQATQQAKSEYDALQTKITTVDKRMEEIATLQKHIGTYRKTKEIYSQYLRSKRNKDFYVKNEKAINACENAKAFFDKQKYETIPSVKDLQVEYAKCIVEKNQYNDARRDIKQHVLELQLAKKNVEMLLEIKPELEAELDKKRAITDER